EFVEKSLYILVTQKGRLVLAGRREVTDERARRTLVFSVGQQLTRNDPELGEVIELSIAREHVEVEHAERLSAGRVGHHVELKIVDPFFRRDDLGKFQTEDA